jgi:hypothetical protein
VNLTEAAVTAGIRTAVRIQVDGSSTSCAAARPVNATARAPSCTNPATLGSARHARAFTDPRDVVSHTRPSDHANTSGVT